MKLSNIEFTAFVGLDWVGYLVDGEVVKSPVDIEKLPAGRYRLVK